MKVLTDRMGIEKASQTYRRVWDRTAYNLMGSAFPSVEELRACGDVFKCFKGWMKALNTANERAGLHEVETVEDSDNVFACNYKYRHSSYRAAICDFKLERSVGAK